MRIIIFANGHLADPAAAASRWVRSDDLVVAANGGTRHALAAGYPPAHVIGDLDSLSAKVRERLAATGTVIHSHPPAKDETDLELALLWAAEQCPTSIVVLGALGGRPDQALANMLLLALPELEGLDVLIADRSWTVRVIRAGEPSHLRGVPGETLSLLPLGGLASGVTTDGLAYPLVNETLRPGPARGVSNSFKADQATIHLQSGLLWCFHEIRS